MSNSRVGPPPSGVARGGESRRGGSGTAYARKAGEGAVLWLTLLVPIVILVSTVSLQKFEAVMLGTDPWRDRHR